MAYKPTEREYSRGVQIVKDILGSDDIELCRKYADEVFGIAYSIGSSYDEQRIFEIANTILGYMREKGQIE